MSEIKICTRCIMDTTDPDIQFNEHGVCNHCLIYDEMAIKELFGEEVGRQRLEALVQEIKTAGKNKRYNCILGVSGGVDSTYMAYLAKKLGLNPLAVHVDNGWDSELSVHNIEKTLKKLDIDLFTLVLDWDEFKELQISFLKASVPDGEHPSDHAYQAGVFQKAHEEGIKYIMRGTNLVTEGIMPIKWSYSTKDWRYIKNIHKKFSNVKLLNYPHFSLFKLFYYSKIRKIRYVSLLNMIQYNKDHVMRILQDDLGWEYYGGKHYESIYTRFWQGYMLPQKFNIDKRKAHFSTLICSGQMTREEALEKMKEPPYPTDLMLSDREYVMKKLGLTTADFEQILALPRKCYLDYPNNIRFTERIKSIIGMGK